MELLIPFLYVAFCALIWPLSVPRYLSAILVMAAMFIILAPSNAQAAPTTEQCSAAANVAEMVLAYRKAGIEQDVVLAFLQSRGTYSGLAVWAVKSAYDAPADVSPWLLKGSIMGECRKREE